MTQDRLDLQVILEAQAQRERLGQLDLKALLAELDQLEIPDLQDLREVQDRQAPQVLLDQQVLREQQDLRVQQDLLVQQEVKDLLAQREPQAPQD